MNLRSATHGLWEILHKLSQLDMTHRLDLILSSAAIQFLRVAGTVFVRETFSVFSIPQTFDHEKLPLGSLGKEE